MGEFAHYKQVNGVCAWSNICIIPTKQVLNIVILDHTLPI